MRNTDIFYFHGSFGLNLYRWLLLTRGMDRLPKDMWQHIPIYFRYTKIRVLNFEGIPPHLFSKGTNRNHKFSQLWNFVFFLLNFYCKYEASIARIHAEFFSGALKIGKNYVKKSKGTPPYLSCTYRTYPFTSSFFSFSLFFHPSFVRFCQNSFLILRNFTMKDDQFSKHSIFEYCIH